MIFPPLLLQPARDTRAVAIGCVVLLITVGLLWGAVAVGKKLKRSEGNRKCLISYLCFTTGWTLYVAVAAVSSQMPKPLPGFLLALVILGGFVLTGATLAILGLSELGRSPDLLKEGRATGILTLALSSLIVLLMASAIGLGFIEGLRGGTKSMAPPGAEAVFEELGFSIQPHAPWARMDSAAYNPAATAVFQRRNPEGYLMVIAERIPAGTPLDFESLATNVRDNLGRATSGMKLIEQSSEMINGLAGHRMICEATVKGSRLTYLYWLYFTPNVAFQLVAASETSDASVIIPDARKAFASFTLLQPK